MQSGCVCRTRVKCVNSVRPSLTTSVDLSLTTEPRFDLLLSVIFCVRVILSEIYSSTALHCQVRMSYCLAMWFVWMGRQMQNTHLQPHWSSGEDPLGDTLCLSRKYYWWPDLFGHWAIGDMRCSFQSWICVASKWHNHLVFLQHQYYIWLGYA